MELVNVTPLAVGYTLGMDVDAAEHLVVVVKGTFTIPQNGSQPALADEQTPLVESDTFTGEPGLSAPIYETDYCLRKPFCDVLLHGSAYAPRGRPASRVRVELSLGTLVKRIDVVGPREWKRGLLSARPGRPRPFATMPISYDRAYGGVDDSKPDRAETYLMNPVGVGFHPRRSIRGIVGQALPNTEEPGHRIRRTRGKYRPMSFGPVGRSWAPRPRYAGTYDQHWQDNVFPFLPTDFDERYFQSAPEDQQIPFPRGGETVRLVNLTPDGERVFALPSIDLPIEYTNAASERSEMRPVTP